MSNGILVFVEHREGVINKTSFEAVAAAQQLGAALGLEVSAVVLGADAALAQEVAGYGVAKVISAENAKLAEYTPDAYTEAMEQVVRARVAAASSSSRTRIWCATTRRSSPRVSARG